MKENIRTVQHAPSRHRAGSACPRGWTVCEKQQRKESRNEVSLPCSHHLSVELLRDSFYALQRKASPGIDGVTWAEYETGLGRSAYGSSQPGSYRGAYRAQPSRRVYIPKDPTDGNVRWASRR